MTAYQGAAALEVPQPNMPRRIIVGFLVGTIMITVLLTLSGRLGPSGITLGGFTKLFNPLGNSSQSGGAAKPRATPKPIIKAPGGVVDPGKVSAKSLRNYGYIVLNPNWGDKVVADSKYAARYIGMMDHAGKISDVDPRLIAAIVRHESDFNHWNPVGTATDGTPLTLSFSGNGPRGHAIGLGQLLADTARNEVHVNPYNNLQNLIGTGRYLRKMLSDFDNNLDQATAAYNAGPGNVQRYGIGSEQNNYHHYVEQYYRRYGGQVH